MAVTVPTNGQKLKWRDRVVGFERRPAKDFQAHPLNFRRHPNNQRDAFRGVLSEIGFAGAVLENVRTGNLVDGHLRIEEALSIDEDQLIPCVQVDLSEAEEKLLLSTYDPISAMAATDKEALERLLKDVSASSDAVDSLLADIAKKNGVVLEQKDVPDAQIDRAAELQEKWKVKRGDLYEIASQTAPNRVHRLLCGDATDKADVRAVCGDKRPFVLTDPPYGVSVVKDAMVGADFGVAKKGKYPEIVGDADTKTAERFFATSQELGFKDYIIWGGNYFAEFLPFSTGWIIWDKRGDSGIKNTFADGEMAWTNTQKQVRIYTQLWNGMIREGESGQRFAPTQKPIKLIQRIIDDFCDSDVYDPFVGSGTTICAAEINKRACYAIEIKPEYVSVTLERLSLMGLEPKLVQEVHGKAA